MFPIDANTIAITNISNGFYHLCFPLIVQSLSSKKKTRNCAIFDKSTKLSGVLAYGMKFIFRRGAIEFSELGGGLQPFLWFPLILGIIARPTNFEKPYLHFHRFDFHKFDIKLFRKERPFKQNSEVNIRPCP